MGAFKQPVYNGTIELNAQEHNLSGTVKIVRDKSGVAHVYAKSTTDVLFGQGFAQAQERYVVQCLNSNHCDP